MNRKFSLTGEIGTIMLLEYLQAFTNLREIQNASYMEEVKTAIITFIN
jgi:hypothetical protein